MKKLLALLLLSPLAFAEDKLTPLYEIVEQNKNRDDAQVAYVNTRCLALFTMVETITNGASQGESAEINAIAKSQIEKMVAITYRYFQITREDSSSEAFGKYLKSSMVPIAVIYDETARDNWIKNGNYFQGSFLIFQDTTFCVNYMDKFPDID